MKKTINIILLILWMIFIFKMSGFNASESSGQSSIIVDFITKILNIQNTEIITFIIRKLAHITEYFILAILSYNVFKDYKIKNIFIITILFCTFYACTDEIHQMFIPGRSGNIIDVLIDGFGSLRGVIFYKNLKKLQKSTGI